MSEARQAIDAFNGTCLILRESVQRVLIGGEEPQFSCSRSFLLLALISGTAVTTAAAAHSALEAFIRAYSYFHLQDPQNFRFYARFAQDSAIKALSERNSAEEFLKTIQGSLSRRQKKIRNFKPVFAIVQQAGGIALQKADNAYRAAMALQGAISETSPLAQASKNQSEAAFQMVQTTRAAIGALRRIAPFFKE